MSLPFTCPHCFSGFSVSEEDRGFSVYCPSCGRECEVPQNLGPGADEERSDRTDDGPPAEGAPERGSLAPRETAPAGRLRRRASVFTSAGATQVMEKTVGEAECLSCHTKFPYTVEDYGTTVYCPSCGDGVHVGEQLKKVAMARATASDEDQADATSVDVSKPRFYWVRSKAALATFFVFIGAASFGAYATWKDPSLLPEGLREVIAGPPPAVVPDPAAGPAQPEKEPQPDVITLEGIRALLKEQDARIALVKARNWDRDLEADGVPATERRRRELKTVMQKLLQKLSGKRKPPPFVAEFDGLLDDMRKALTNSDADAARKLFERANALFDAHADVLGGRVTRLMRYKAWLLQLEREVTGPAALKKMLDQAVEHAKNGRPTAAIEMHATALFRSRPAALSQKEKEELKQRVRVVMNPLLGWSRGKRAVADAEECQRLGDFAARNRQLDRIALKFLPEIPSSLPLLPQTNSRELNRRARELRKRAHEGSRTTALGQALDWRLQYENALLEQFAHGRTIDFAQAAARLKRAYDGLPAEARSSAGIVERFQRLRERAFDMIDNETIDFPQLDGPKLSQRIAKLRTALRHLDVWKKTPHWQAIDALLERSAREIIERRLARARASAGEGDFKEALRAARDLQKIGDDTIARQAAELRKKWETEVALRKSKQAQEQHLGRIEKLLEDGKPLDASREIDLFQTRYPRPQAPQRLQKLQQRLKDPLQKRIDAVLDQAEKLQQAGRRREFRATTARLQGIPLSSGQQARYNKLNKAIADLDKQIEGLLASLRRAEKMATPEEIILVRKLSAKVLALDPDSKQAADLQKKAEKLAKSMAAKMVPGIESYVRAIRNGRITLKDRLKRRLQELYQLDPEGPYGLKAKRYLLELKRL